MTPEITKDEFVPYAETLRATVTRTAMIAVFLATFSVVRRGDLTPFPLGLWAVLVVCILWFSFCGHWVEIFFLNYLRPRLPRNRPVQVIARFGVWFLGGVALMAGMRATWELLMASTAPWGAPWWQGGVSFVVVELIAHAVLLQSRGLPSFYNGKG